MPDKRVVFNPWLAFFQLGQAALDANVVIAMRLARLASGGALAQRETQRMVMEKGLTLVEAQLAAATKLMSGGGISGATKSASDTFRRKVKSNRRRLVR